MLKQCIKYIALIINTNNKYPKIKQHISELEVIKY